MELHVNLSYHFDLGKMPVEVRRLTGPELQGVVTRKERRQKQVNMRKTYLLNSLTLLYGIWCLCLDWRILKPKNWIIGSKWLGPYRIVGKFS